MKTIEGKCKKCGQILRSPVEKEYKLCPQCLREENTPRAKTGKVRSEGGKPRRKKTDKKTNKRYTSKESAFAGANKKSVVTKIPEEAYEMLKDKIGRSNTSMSKYLRNLILQDLDEEKE